MSEQDDRLRTCGQHPTLGDVSTLGGRGCRRVLAVEDLYRCVNCNTAYCKHCIQRHFKDETPEELAAFDKAADRAYADAEDPLEEPR